MPIEPGDSERAAEIAARSASRRRKLTYEDVVAELGELETPADAKRWLKTAFTWGASGRIPGTMANACGTCVREWLRAHQEEIDLSRIKALEARIAELEAELGDRPDGWRRR